MTTLQQKSRAEDAAVVQNSKTVSVYTTPRVSAVILLVTREERSSSLENQKQNLVASSARCAERNFVGALAQRSQQ